jgi:hypothetical protein
MERIAVCLFGLVGGVSGKDGKGEGIEIEIVRSSFEHALKNYQVDYYIHTWSVEREEELVRNFSPKVILSEPRLKIDKTQWDSEIKKKESYRSKLVRLFRFKTRDIRNLREEAYRAYSRWTSTSRAFNLIRESDLPNYDYVISSRLDLEIFNTIALPSNLTDGELLVSHWNDAKFTGTRNSSLQNNYSLVREGYLDLWFAGRPVTMKNFCSLIDRFEKYSFSPHLSSREHAAYLNLSSRFFLYRGFDFEIVRRHRYNAVE